MEDDGFDIFGPSDSNRLDEVMALISHYVSEHDMPTEAAINILLDIVRPGGSDNSHDVRPMFVGAMWALGFGYLCPKIESLYINSMPWGVAFAISTDKDFRFDHLSKTEQQGVIKSLCLMLQAGGLNARVSADNHIILTDDAGEETRMDIDTMVSQFRVEIDKELGPDRPEDPMRKWMP
jgi:hypothetical protein